MQRLRRQNVLNTSQACTFQPYLIRLLAKIWAVYNTISVLSSRCPRRILVFKPLNLFYELPKIVYAFLACFFLSNRFFYFTKYSLYSGMHFLHTTRSIKMHSTSLTNTMTMVIGVYLNSSRFGSLISLRFSLRRLT